MKAFGVALFFIGVVAFAFMTIRRGRNVPMAWPDYTMMFVGLAGTIAGITMLFSRF